MITHVHIFYSLITEKFPGNDSFWRLLYVKSRISNPEAVPKPLGRELSRFTLKNKNKLSAGVELAVFKFITDLVLFGKITLDSIEPRTCSQALHVGFHGNDRFRYCVITVLKKD